MVLLNISLEPSNTLQCLSLTGSNIENGMGDSVSNTLARIDASECGFGAAPEHLRRTQSIAALKEVPQCAVEGRGGLSDGARKEGAPVIDRIGRTPFDQFICFLFCEAYVQLFLPVRYRTAGSTFAHSSFP